MLFRSLGTLIQPPRLAISVPKDGQSVVNPVTVVGKTDRDASLSLNDKTINLEPDGRFVTTVEVSRGNDELVFRATSRRQRVNEIKLRVTVID